jgi:iron(III) transport system ATP-binding protein
VIRIENLCMSYRSAGEAVAAARGVSIDIPQGQFFTLLGPSGCGKTTTLRCVAGLEEPDTGTIVVGGEIVYSSANGTWVPPFRRNIGMVFQSYAIWPHMSVYENVAFPLMNAETRLPREDVQKRVLSALSLVKLSAYVDRPAPFLSGGQQQRLALARALVGEPRVLLLDEPLSNLDAKLREEMRVELRELVKRLNVTTLFVTHEQIEALTMSDVVAVMRDGTIVQAGPPRNIYSKPQSAFVAQFIGRTNFIDGHICEPRTGHNAVSIDTSIGPVLAQTDSVRHAGDKAILAIRPEEIEVDAAAQATEPNTFGGVVERQLFVGEAVECIVRIADTALQVRLNPNRAPEIGSHVRVRLPPERCLALNPES